MVSPNGSPSSGAGTTGQGATGSTVSASSAMSRTMRFEILSLDLARHSSKLQALSQKSLVNSGKALDRLMETELMLPPPKYDGK